MSYEGDSPHHERDFQILQEILRRGMPNPKLEDRKALLEAHPELRRRINFEPLRQIIDIVSFKCVHRSSIARDQAIEGSDIDGGLVVLREPVGQEAEMAFIEELRAQGFDVYHPSEAAAAKAAFDQAIEHGLKYNDPEFDGLNHAHNVTEMNQVVFMPEEELRNTDMLNGYGKTYMFGYTIPEIPVLPE
jgi:hypothetical protein